MRLHSAYLICLLVLQLLGLSQLSGFAAAAAASRPSDQGIQYTPDVLRDYDLADVALLVYKTQPDVITEVLQSLVEDGGLDHESAEQILETFQIQLNFSFSANRSEVDFACAICKPLVGSLKGSAITRTMWNDTTDRWISRCENISIPLGIKGDVLCRGTLEHQMAHVYEILKPQASNDIATVCEFLNLCLPAPEVQSESRIPTEKTRLQLFSRKAATNSDIAVNSEGKKQARAPPTIRQAPPENSLIVVQLTDVHVEPKYAVGTETDCGLPVCCVQEYGKGYAGKFGDYNCNIPRTTIEVFLQKVLTFTPDVVLFSGDVPPHSTWDETEESQIKCSETLVEVFTQSLPGYKVYPNIGNHEGYPTNLFSVKSMAQYTPEFLTSYANLWQPLANFSSEEIADIVKGGFYTKVVAHGLRLISFNTNYMYTFNWYNVNNHKRLQGSIEYETMTDFVNATLQQARNDREKVILMGHHPPGGADYLVKGSRWYRDLVLQYSDIIVLQPTGHTHYDEFRMIYDAEGIPRSVVLVAPSMSSGGTRNPSMRVFYLDKNTKEVLDYDHYYLNIGPDSLPPENWADMITLLYSAKDEYGMPDLSPASWHDLLNRFEVDSVLLNTHRLHRLADADETPETPNICLDRCQHNYVCRMRHVNYDQYKNCTISLLDIDWGSQNWTITRPTLPPSPVNSAENLMSATYLTLFFAMSLLFTMVRGQLS